MVELNKAQTVSFSQTQISSKSKAGNTEVKPLRAQKTENLTPKQNDQLMRAIKEGKIERASWGAYYSTMGVVPLMAQYSNGREIGLDEQYRNNQQEAASLYNQAVKDGIINPEENALGSTIDSTS